MASVFILNVVVQMNAVAMQYVGVPECWICMNKARHPAVVGEVYCSHGVELVYIGVVRCHVLQLVLKLPKTGRQGDRSPRQQRHKNDHTLRCRGMHLLHDSSVNKQKFNLNLPS